MFNKVLDQILRKREPVYLSNGAKDLYEEARHQHNENTDRIFTFLFLFQWLLGLFFAFTFSAQTWAGAYGTVHFHVYMAVFLGGALALYPAYQNWKYAGATRNRCVSAIAQMGFSALFVHLTDGRIESHFHIFGSLAFLAFYRNSRVLIVASLVTALDHFVMGAVAPLSVYGTLSSTPWRALEHTLWVVFEDVFLFISIRESLREMKLIAQNQFDLQRTLATVEKLAADRTADLAMSKETILEQQRTLTTTEGQAETVALTLIHTIVERAAGFRESKIRARGVKVKIDMPAHRLYVNGRANELIQSVVHLFDHAIDSMGLNEQLKIEVRKVGDSIETVIESGGKRSLNDKGVDYSIAQNSVKAHGGELVLDISAEGTRFVMTLPNALAATTPAPERSAS